MSYQFEDDSALEELLNQQLDRRRQQTLSGRPVTGSSRVTQPFRPSTSRPNNELQSQSQSQTQLEKNLSPAAAQTDQLAAPKGKLANWLAATDNAAASSTPTLAKQTPTATTMLIDDQKANKIQPPASRKLSASTMVQQETTVLRRSSGGAKSSLDFVADETKLQEMSKQRLIQFILEEIQPNLREFIDSSDMKLRKEVDRLNLELEEEKDRHRKREAQQIDLIESKWQQLNKQLEARLEISATELREARQGRKSQIKELDDEFKRQMKQLGENYQFRLEEEKRTGEEALKRSQELHRLELESKLKVNIELDKLETTFAEWQRMVRLTVGELSEHLKTIENLLEKQTLEVNTTNVNLTKKSQQLSEQYAKFELRTGQLDNLSSQLSEQILPQFSLAQKESQSAIDKLTLQLRQLNIQTEFFERAKVEFDRLRTQLETNKDELGKEKFHVALELSRLGFKEEKLNDLLEKNEKIESELMEQKSAHRQKERKFDALESSFNSKSKKLREQNYELHLIRKKLASKEEDLASRELRLSENSDRLQSDGTKLGEDKKRLDELRNKIKRESSQLLRLQKSLICSLCFGRLFDTDEQTSGHERIPLASSRDFHHLAKVSSNQHQCRREQFASCNPIGHRDSDNSKNWDVKRSSVLELDDISDYIEADGRLLESECKYVDLVPMN